MQISDITSPNQQLDELRRSEIEKAPVPDKFSESGHEAAVQFLKTIPAAQRANYAVTMTNLPKVGLNPKSSYNTPIGIYFYPADYYLRKAVKTELPFQHNANYIQILKLTTDQILFVNKVTTQDYEDFVEKLSNLPSIKTNSEVSRSITQFHTESASKARIKKPGGQLWYVLWKTSDLFAKLLNKTSHIVWNWLLRQLGYKIIMDTGSMIIHRNEPNQGVILDPVGSYQWIKTIQNTSKLMLTLKHLLKTKFTSLDLEQKTKFLEQMSTQYELHQFILNYPKLIRLVHNEDLLKSLMMSRKIARVAFKYIKNPSEKIIKTALESDGTLIQYIHNPGDLFKTIAVKNNSEALKYIDNPSDSLVLDAIKNSDGDAIEFIKNPSEKMKKMALKLNGHNIRHIENPSKELQMIAVSTYVSSLEYIKNPDPDVVEFALENDEGALIHLKNPSDKLKMTAIKYHPMAIEYIANPTEEMQLLAVEQDSYVLSILLKKYILPSQTVIDAAIAAHPDDKEGILAQVQYFKHKQKKKSAK